MCKFGTNRDQRLQKFGPIGSKLTAMSEQERHR
jgi:hypothetical protein